MREKHPFEPIYDKNSKILILGSFPSVKSREANFYYSQPLNRFWRVLAKIHKQKEPKSVGQKRKFLLDNKIAIWDVVKECEIEGSSDASITNVELNDILTLLNKTKIKKVYLNGRTAYSLFVKNLSEELSEDIKFELLPSTSSANAAFCFDKLVTTWKKILED